VEEGSERARRGERAKRDRKGRVWGKRRVDPSFKVSIQ